MEYLPGAWYVVLVPGAVGPTATAGATAGAGEVVIAASGAGADVMAAKLE